MGPPADPDPVACLLALADAAARGVPVGPQVARWLVCGVRRYLTGSGPLDRALGLSGNGWKGSTRWAYHERNRALRRAAELAGGPEALARALARFEAVMWPRWRGLDAPPPGASPLQRELFSALKSAKVPQSSRQLRRILAG